MYLKKNKWIGFLSLTLTILFFFHLYLQTNFFPKQYVYTEWLINYEGGFVKRGLGGQIIIEITKLLKIKLEFATLVIQTLGYLMFFYFFYQFTKKININLLCDIFIDRLELLNKIQEITIDMNNIRMNCNEFKILFTDCIHTKTMSHLLKL